MKNTPITKFTIRPSMPRHGGAWKVAYADFVTAMMAFFLLMWLLNVTTEEQKNAISNYFDPTNPKVSQSESGAGGVMGGLTMSAEGSMSSTKQPVIPPREERIKAQKVHEKGKDRKTAKIEEIKEAIRQTEEAKFKKAEDELKKALAANPKLKELSDNLKIDVTKEGLRIQIIDQEGKPMFASGSAQMFEKTQNLMGEIADIIKSMPNELSIRGHTDSIPYGKGASYTNWELSSDRANATRRVLKDGGIETSRLNNVMGKADTEPLIPEDPTDAQNRRISIIMLREELTNPDFAKEAIEQAERRGEFDFTDEELEEGGDDSEYAPDHNQSKQPVGTFRRTPGNIDFP